MTLDQLRALLTVSKTRSFRAAARELHLTQPAISKQIKALQHSFGIEFYKRHGNTIELTEAGHLAFNKLESIFKRLDAFENLFHPAMAPATRQALTVAATFGLARRVITTAIARLKRANPGVEIGWEIGSAYHVQDMVQRGEAGVGLTGYRPMFDDLAGEPFSIENLVFFVHPRHPLARRGTVTLKEVLAHDLVIRSVKNEPTATHDMLEELAQRGYSYKVALWCDQPLLIRDAVAKNVGVGIAFKENLKADLRRRRFILLKGSDFHFTAVSYIVYRKNRGLPPLAQKFLEILRRAKKVKLLEHLDQMAAGTVARSDRDGIKNQS